MSEALKITIIAAGTAIFCVGLSIYFSPYQSCVRAASVAGAEAKILAKIRCKIERQ